MSSNDLLHKIAVLNKRMTALASNSVFARKRERDLGYYPGKVSILRSLDYRCYQPVHISTFYVDKGNPICMLEGIIRYHVFNDPPETATPKIAELVRLDMSPEEARLWCDVRRIKYVSKFRFKCAYWYLSFKRLLEVLYTVEPHIIDDNPVGSRRQKQRQQTRYKSRKMTDQNVVS